MANGSKVTLTVFFTLIFGSLSSALINIITDNNGVHWANVYRHIEFYILLVLGIVVIVLSNMTARETTKQLRVIQEKLEAVQLQGFLVGKQSKAMPAIVPAASEVQPRALEFTANAHKALESQANKMRNRVMAVLQWLQYANASEIVMSNNIAKVDSDSPQDFMVRVGRLRINIDIDLQKGKLVVKEIQRKSIA